MGSTLCDLPATMKDYRDLSIAERLRLVEDIWDSIAAESGALPLTPAQAAELDRRLERLRREGPDDIDGFEAIRELRDGG